MRLLFHHNISPLAFAALSMALWLSLDPLLVKPTRLVGLSFADSPSGVLRVILLLLATGLATIVLGSLCRSVCTPTRSIAAILAGPAALAVTSGPITGWFERSADNIPPHYRSLLLEVVLLQLFLMVILTEIQFWAPRFASILRTHQAQAPKENPIPSKPWTSAIGPAVLSAVLSGVIACFLVRSPAIGQVGWGLFFSFLLGTLIANLILPAGQTLGPALLTPALVGAAGYAVPLFSYSTSTKFLHDWYTGRLLGLDLALPIHYVAFGSLGAVFGFYFAQGLITPEPAAKAVEAAEAPTAAS